jgi:hypothetical protein
MKNYTSTITQILSRMFLLFVLALLSCGIGFSQTASLSASNVVFAYDTSSLSATDSMKVTVRNINPVTYTGILNINFSTMTDTTPVLGCTTQTVSLTLNANDSVRVACTITFDSVHFQQGDNIVVVWSSGTLRTQVDSVWAHIYLNPSTAGVHETGPGSAFKIYPSPTQDIINVEFSGNIVPLKIFIEDVSGRIIKAVSPSHDNKKQIKINTSELNTGIYFLNILLPDKQRVISKFVKEE